MANNKKEQSFENSMLMLGTAGVIIYLISAEVARVATAAGITISPAQAGFGLSIVAFFVYLVAFAQDKIKNNKRYHLRPWSAGSFANYNGWTDGHGWTPASRVKEEMRADEDKTLFLDYFRFDRSVKEKLSAFLPSKKYEKEPLFINPKSLVRGALIAGQMGAGKTELYNSLIAHGRENHLFSRIVIHDSKGDYMSHFYDSRRDICANIYDKRGAVWDMWGELDSSPLIASAFFDNYFAAVSGEDKDFWSGQARLKFESFVNKILVDHASLSSAEKYQKLVDFLSVYFDEIKKGSDKMAQSIVGTMEMVVEFWQYLAWRVGDKNTKLYTIKEFLSMKSTNILFLHYKDDQASKLVPYFAGFIATFSAIMLSSAEKKERDDLTLLALDEYITLAKNLDENTLSGLHTRVRSKGGCLIPGVQYVAENNAKFVQNLMNSCEYFFLFQLSDAFTIEKMNKVFGKQIYSASRDENESQGDVFTSENFHRLKDSFCHITAQLSEGIVYKAYTPRVRLEKIAKESEDIDYREFLTWKHNQL